MPRSSRLCCAAAVVIVGLAAPRPAQALDPGRAITQYVLESWTAQDGAPSGSISGITQTPDGYLWLGSEGEGLVRFDGVAFVHVDGLDKVLGHRVDGVTSLMCGRDGALWVGTHLGLARFKEGVWTAFDRGEGGRDVFGLHEGADGTVWFARHWEGLYSVAGDTLTFTPLAMKPRFVTSDTRGILWVGGYDGLWRIAGKERRLYTAADGLPDPNVNTVYGDRDGNVWVGIAQGLLRLRDDKVVARFATRDGLSNNDVRAISVDHDAGLWVGTASGGLNRRRGKRFESLTKTLGLTNNRVTALYEDREGSLWAGTAGGLNRLRDASLLPIGETEGLSRNETFSIVEGKDGSVFVSSGFGGLNELKDGRVRTFPVDLVPGTGTGFYGPLYADGEGGVWSGHRDGLYYRGPDGRGTRYVADGQVACIGHDARGIVFATGAAEVFRLVDGKAERYRLADGSLIDRATYGFDYVWMIYGSRDGTLWLATSRGAIAVRDGRARVVWLRGTLSARSISEDEEGTIWLGTMAGAVRIAGETVTTFTTREGLPRDDVYSVVSDGRGGIWMSGGGGILRVARRELEAVAQGTAQAFAVERFDAAEGMRTSEATNTYQPAGCSTQDGRVWFTTVEGVVVADPAHIRRNPLPPPVVLEGIIADGKGLDTGPQETRVPAGTERLAILYNGLSLLMPKRVEFRYKLEGYDRDWVDAQGRRVAYYTKLPPAKYRFRVMASNNDGLWNEVGASVDFQQLPRFYQTAWFLIAAIIAATGSILGLYRLRILRHERLERLLQGRIAEALAEISTLSGLLPICAWCKKVRDDTGYWSQLETYVKDHSHAEFSHGICPECSEKMRAKDRAVP